MKWWANHKKWKYVRQGATVEEQLIRRFEMFGTSAFYYFSTQVFPPDYVDPNWNRNARPATSKDKSA